MTPHDDDDMKAMIEGFKQMWRGLDDEPPWLTVYREGLVDRRLRTTKPVADQKEAKVSDKKVKRPEVPEGMREGFTTLHTADLQPDGKIVPGSWKATNPKDAIGLRKPAMSVMPMGVLYEIAAGMTEGALKYGRHNYRVAGVRASVYFDAAMRHLAAWWEGEDTDPDSGIHHLSKAMSTLMVLRDAQMNDMVKFDDRPPLPKAWMGDAKTLFETIHARHPEPEAPHTMAQDDDGYSDIFNDPEERT